MAILMNYTVHCTDATTGQKGCFLFDTDHWQKTGEFKATSAVFPSLAALYEGTPHDSRQSCYLERAKP